MTDEQVDRLVKVLERIAYALEVAHFTKQATAVPTTPSSGYQCPRCYSWVPNGSLHSCSGYSVGGSAGSYVVCSELGPNGGRCYLAKGHTSLHEYAIVWNVNG